MEGGGAENLCSRTRRRGRDGILPATDSRVPFCRQSKTIYEEIEPKLMEKNEISPLLELELVAPTIEWQPDLGEASSGDGVRDAFNSWIKGFLSVGTLMKRLDMTKWIFLYRNYVHL